MTSRRRLVVALVVLAAVFWIGAAGYALIAPEKGFLDAVYMAAITLSTVGFTEVIPRTAGMQVWTIVIILFGLTSALVAFGSLTGMIVEGEIGRLIGSRKLESRIRQLQGHVIVAGYGLMGQQVVRRLAERKVPLVVLESDPVPARRAEELGQLCLVADATEETSLRRAGIERARSLVAVLAGDADNVFVTLTAREMNPTLCIVARAEQFSAEPKLRRAGANRVILPQAIGAERIVNVLTRPHVVDLMEVAAKGVELEVDEFVVTAESPIAGKSLRQADIRNAANVMVVAIRRADGSTRFNPGADEVLHPADTLITIGPAGAALRLTELRILPDLSPGDAL